LRKRSSTEERTFTGRGDKVRRRSSMARKSGGKSPDQTRPGSPPSGVEPGLRGRRRPDESLAREIHEILTKDPELDATNVEVEVESGAVTLIGVVESSDAKLLAEELAESITGVREVHNRLRVARDEEE
jgi:osmotically-inducible protein OsmY